ncbi:unnamed protein product [Camellia sinensis]
MKVMDRTGNASVSSSKPNVVNIGALYTFNSVIGQSAKPGIEAAVDDVNSDSTVLAGMKLNLILHDTNCSGFLGTVEALQLMENDVVVIGLRNGIFVLGDDALAKKCAKISYKVPKMYTWKDDEEDIDEHESIRPKSTLLVTSFKDFADKKEDKVMESVKQKSDSKRQASQCSDRHPSSPSR